MVSPESALGWERRYHRDMAVAGLRGFVFGHILEGRLHVNLLAEDEAASRRCGELLERWAAGVVAEGGVLVAENGAGKLRAALAVRFLGGQRLEQIRGIIERLDPGCVMGGFPQGRAGGRAD
jgi:FAD/FMN-containing dehydrogenase